MTPADLVVDVDVAVRRERSVARRRARHTLRGRTVHTVATAGHDVRVKAVDLRDWRSELGLVCRMGIPDDAPAPPSAEVELPWDLVVGTGAALAAHRRDLYAELLTRTDDGVREQVGRLHLATVGRLRAVGTLPARRRVGWVAWVLVADGWRALTPYVVAGPAGPRPMVRLDRREPEDLAHDVARWATGAGR